MIIISKENLYWIAALLEGEGCFHRDKDGTSSITLAMIDLDIMERARDIISPNSKISPIGETTAHKTIYRINLYGKDAIEWMKLLYPLMGLRRREKITEILSKWENRKRKGLDRTTCPRDHDLTNPDNYWLQGNHKVYKICQKTWVEEKTRKNVIKAIAKSKNISYEEAETFLLSSIKSEVNNEE